MRKRPASAGRFFFAGANDLRVGSASPPYANSGAAADTPAPAPASRTIS
jgi:hypothetical protein